jgi:protein-S-isoprenylcysteine O-methyltransferase Ste14
MSSESTTSFDGRTDDDADHGSILAPAPILFAATFLIGVLFDRRKPIEIVLRPANTAIGGLAFVIGTALFAGAIHTLGDAGTGPSHEDEPPPLVTEGPFAYSRNPIYLGNCLQYLGLAALYNSAWPVVVLAPLLAYFDRVIEREESSLASEFGEAFERYRESVPRLI